MFSSVTAAPPDPILGITEIFKADSRNGKLNLTVGVYCDENGRTPVFGAVKQAEERLLATESSKDYLPIAGSAEFADAVLSLLFPDADAELLGRVSVADTPGGTGALSVAARLLWRTNPASTVWISSPTWPNHFAVFADAGLSLKRYRYYEAATAAVLFDEMMEDLQKAQPGDAVLVHGCCHNPTGQDLTTDQWASLAAFLRERDLVAVVDSAYIGLGEGVEKDTAPVRLLTASGVDVLCCVSFSKNLGLYGERVGALVTAAADHQTCERVYSQVKACARSIYSNPPRHGGQLVPLILADDGLRASWLAELDGMRNRINSLRSELAAEIQRRGLTRCVGVDSGRGMFALSGLTKDEVLRLREESGIYLVDNGRMNIAALTTATIPVLVDALALLG
ncbi:MAG: aspartate/tyrosine/aromatic aminotransferase [Acidimicrobiales bacterium]|nr:aspartate/tyrosine/aromatic aminotransferase [Acidimicrobiales bacterium]